MVILIAGLMINVSAVDIREQNISEYNSYVIQLKHIDELKLKEQLKLVDKIESWNEDYDIYSVRSENLLLSDFYPAICIEDVDRIDLTQLKMSIKED